MHVFAVFTVPDVRVGLVVAGDRFFAKPFQIGENIPVGRAMQPLVEKSLCTGQNGRTVNVVLDFAKGAVADSDRPLAVVAGQCGGDPFFQFGIAVNAVDRL